jgi:hypothetical protein
MIVHDVIQGTPEWLALRAGIPTASRFDDIITPRGEPSRSAKRYMLELLAERCMGKPIVEYVSFPMRRGSAVETEAVAWYEALRDVETVPVGFITNDERTVGASPDRVVGTDGLLETKCPFKEHVHMDYLMGGELHEAHRVQVQGQLWVTGRLWCDLVSYHPDLPTAITRCPRDDIFIAKLSRAVEAFAVQLGKHVGYCREMGWMR